MSARNDPLLKLDVAKRRGIVRDPDINSWDALLLRGLLDDIDARLVKSKLCGAVKEDVTDDVLRGKLKQPAGEWALLVRLRGQPWITFATTRGEDFDLPGQIAKATKLEVVHLGHQDTANSTFFTYFANGKPRVAFESLGMDDDDDGDRLTDTRFKSDRHPKSFLNRFADEAQVRAKLAEEFGVYVPILYADKRDGVIRLDARHRDVPKKQNIERIDLVVFGPAAALDAGAAGQALNEAMDQCDLAAVKEALQGGADVRFLPGSAYTPLEIAIELVASQRGSQRRTAVDIVRALLDAGADPGGDKRRNAAIFTCIRQLNDFHPDLPNTIKVVDMLLDHRADIDAIAVTGTEKGQTPLHLATSMGLIPVVKHLIKRGANPRRKSADGQTARQAAEESLAMMADAGYARNARQTQAVIDVLKSAEQGRPDVSGIKKLAQQNRRHVQRAKASGNAELAALADTLKSFNSKRAQNDWAELQHKMTRMYGKPRNQTRRKRPS